MRSEFAPLIARRPCYPQPNIQGGPNLTKMASLKFLEYPDSDCYPATTRDNHETHPDYRHVVSRPLPDWAGPTKRLRRSSFQRRYPKIPGRDSLPRHDEADDRSHVGAHASDDA